MGITYDEAQNLIERLRMLRPAEHRAALRTAAMRWGMSERKLRRLLRDAEEHPPLVRWDQEPIPTAEQIRALMEKLATLTPEERRQERAQAAKCWGLSARSLNRRIREVWGARRAIRSDAGQSMISEEALREASQLLAQATNRRGKCTLSAKKVTEILTRKGILPPGTSHKTLSNRLRECRLSPRYLRAPKAAISRRSEHPNHVHLVDSSICLSWFLRDDGRIVHLPDSDRVFYKNKPENYRRLRQVLWRYLVVDHRTHCFYPRYYYAPGERPEDLIDCLHRAWSRKNDRLFPFCGVPRILAGDQGPGLKAQTTQHLLESLEVTPDLHLPGNARASGSVEVGHNCWEKWFEVGLLLSPPRDLDELNELAYARAIEIQAKELHERYGKTRFQAWLSWMQDEHMREAPDQDVWWALARRDEIERTVDGYNRISVTVPGVKGVWELRGEVRVGEKVKVVPYPYRAEPLRVWNSSGDELEVVRIEFDEAGMALTGRGGGWAGEDYDRHRDQEIDRIRRAAQEHPIQLTPYEAHGDPRREVAGLAFLGAPRPGRPALAEEARRTAITYGRFEAKQRVRAAAGRPLTKAESAWFDAQVGEKQTVTAEELEQLVAGVLQSQTAAG